MNNVKTAGFVLAGMLVIQACAPSVPVSNAGPGFSDYAQYEMERARREAALNGARPATFEAPAPVQTAPIGQTSGIATSDLAAAGIGQSAPSVAPQAAPLTAVSSNATTQPTPTATSNTGISDEQDFDAVASRESIQSDAERRASNAAAREEVMPTAIPTRTSNAGPNIVEYALNAPNAKGQEWYSRSILSTQGRFQRNCVKYMSPDAAQRDFLESGGPERDTKGLDPDGDGFACGWDPAPFLLAAGR